MINKPLVSIIVPVYNVESWLNKCIDSLIVQSYKNIEILLINDGSTDGSGKICDGYLNKSDIIRVFNNENKGLSYSRNFGIRNSTGKYIMFVDSDDFIIDINIVEKFVEILERENSDFIYTSYCRFEDGEEDIVTENLPINIKDNDIKDKNGIEVLSLLISKKSYHHAAYLKICKRDFLINNNLYFKEGVYHEDADWSPKLFYYSKKISLYNKPYYMRRMRENSIITTTNEVNTSKKINDRLIIAYELVNFFKTMDENNEKSIIIHDLVRMYWGDLMLIIKLKDKENFNNCCNTFKSTKEVLGYGNQKKYKIANILIKLIGVKNFLVLAKKRVC